jgi:acetyl-CoA carboxylase biotin carboxyl carrier protein
MRESVIKRLIKLVEESQIEELEVSRWGRKVRISKKARAAETDDGEPTIAVRPTAGEASPPPASQSDKGAARADNLVAITSPMVGTYYAASSPNTEPFVKVGQVIEKGQVVCIVEAMKLMNEIESDRSGRIVKILLENAQPVEFGQELFLLEPV